MEAPRPGTGVAPDPIPEREIATPVSLCLPDGRLDRSAVGWSRRPLHRCNLRGRWGRKKRWDYWCVTTRDHMVSFTYANIDYLGLASVAFLDFAEQEWLESAVAIPFGLGFSQPETVGGGNMAIDRFGLQLSIREERGVTALRAKFKARSGERVDAQIDIGLPPDHETLSVVVPWSDRAFQFTSKHNTRPARGRVLVDGRYYGFEAANDAFGCLDYGRGIWPYRTHWNWASASGHAGGKTVGLQFGAKWTDGTGSTENALCVDGRLSKISEELVFDYDTNDFQRPWRITAPITGRVDLTFTPFYEKQLRGDAGVLGGQLHLCFGHYAGTVIDDHGVRHHIADLVGWAEEVKTRW